MSDADRYAQMIANDYADFVMNAYFREGGTDLKIELAKLEKNIQDYGDFLRNFIRQAQAVRQHIAEEELRRQGKAREDLRQRFKKDFEHLRKLPGVKNVRIDNRYVSVYTEDIIAHVEATGKDYNLGPYIIHYISDGRIVINNPEIASITGQEQWVHPHIWEGGNEACFGNIAVGLMKMVGAFEYASATQVLLQFLRQVNHDVLGNLTYWAGRRVGPDGNLIYDKYVMLSDEQVDRQRTAGNLARQLSYPRPERRRDTTSTTTGDSFTYMVREQTVPADPPDSIQDLQVVNENQTIDFSAAERLVRDIGAALINEPPDADDEVHFVEPIDDEVEEDYEWRQLLTQAVSEMDDAEEQEEDERDG